MFAKLTAENQLTLPKSITEAIAEIEYFEVKVEDGKIILMPDHLLVVPECQAPFDIPFLLLAIVGIADYLVTSDNDLLCL